MKVLVFFITCYQKLLSPFLGDRCRFYPSCSQYMKESVELHGFSGLCMGTRRLFKCHPFHPGGYDPVSKNLPAIREESHG